MNLNQHDKGNAMKKESSESNQFLRSYRRIKKGGSMIINFEGTENIQSRLTMQIIVAYKIRVGLRILKLTVRTEP